VRLDGLSFGRVSDRSGAVGRRAADCPTSRFWPQPPKTIRPISSPRCLTSSGSEAFRKRSARLKNSCCLRLSASMPFSMSSTSIRFALSLRAFAKLRTCAAMFAGKLTLCRTTRFAVLTAPLCTRLVRMVLAQQLIRHNDKPAKWLVSEVASNQTQRARLHSS